MILFKLSLAPNSDLVSGQSWQASLPRLADASRYWLIVKALVLNALAVGKAYVFILPLCFFLLGRDPQRPRLALVGVLGVLFMMLLGYFFVYVTTPYDLAGHLRTSIGRLLMQLWPAAILAMFLALADPVHVLAETSSPRESTVARRTQLVTRQAKQITIATRSSRNRQPLHVKSSTVRAKSTAAAGVRSREPRRKRNLHWQDGAANCPTPTWQPLTSTESPGGALASCWPGQR